uniref:Uncharacterized protein n=1 Tax=Sarcophilus harrisii TaxID=9305 RepID=A0A7N4P116_SARHA
MKFKYSKGKLHLLNKKGSSFEKGVKDFSALFSTNGLMFKLFCASQLVESDFLSISPETSSPLLLFKGALKLNPNKEPVAELLPNANGFDFSLLKMLLTDSEPNTNFGGETTALVGVSEVLHTSPTSRIVSVVSESWFKSVLSLVVSSNTATAILPHGNSRGVAAREKCGVSKESFSWACFASSKICLNASATSCSLKRTANCSTFLSPSAKSHAVQTHTLSVPFMFCKVISGVTL